MSALFIGSLAVIAAVPLIDGIPAERGMKGLRVFFAHQSVGDNILDGVREIAPEVTIVHGESRRREPGIVETLVGENGSPASKLAHFSRAMRAMGGDTDVAMMKFCYIDVSAATDVPALERSYSDTMDALQVAYRHTRFVHVTIPLTVTGTGPGATVRRWLDRPVWGEAENRNRGVFNDWLRSRYAGAPIFNLAAIESSTPAGGGVTFRLDGRSYWKLNASYSDDGRHLGRQGRHIAAAAFLTLLDRLAREHRS